MPKKTHLEELKRDPVTMYETIQGASLNSIARGLSTNRSTLKTGWSTPATASPAAQTSLMPPQPLMPNASANSNATTSDCARNATSYDGPRNISRRKLAWRAACSVR
ncbi:MAG: hypothetical protein L0K17_05510 [Corynebacterium sp.]|nr:hypothetical protein [Corynebacterium sp.]